LKIGGEPYQRAFHIVKQPRPGPRHGSAARDEDIVTAGPRMKGRQEPGRLPQTPFGPVAHHRSADPFRGGKADTDEIAAVAASTSLGEDGAPRADLTLGRGQEIRSFLQPFNIWIGQARLPTATALGRQALTTPGATPRDNLLTVLGGHARAKAVTALAHQPGRLKSPLHVEATSNRPHQGWIGGAGMSARG